MSPVLAVRNLQGASRGSGREGGQAVTAGGWAQHAEATAPTPPLCPTQPCPAAVWRLVTGHLWHAGLLHIAFNLLAFVPIGSALERGMGSVRVSWAARSAAALAGVPGNTSTLRPAHLVVPPGERAPATRRGRVLVATRLPPRPPHACWPAAQFAYLLAVLMLVQDAIFIALTYGLA